MTRNLEDDLPTARSEEGKFIAPEDSEAPESDRVAELQQPQRRQQLEPVADANTGCHEVERLASGAARATTLDQLEAPVDRALQGLFRGSRKVFELNSLPNMARRYCC